MEIYTTQQAARKLGVKDSSFYYWKTMNWIPKPKRIGRTDHYTAEQINEIRSHLVAGVFRQTKRHGYTIFEVGKKLKICYNTLYHWRSRGYIQQGERHGKRVYYTLEQIEQIKQDIKTGLLWQRGENGERLLNVTEAARYCGENVNTFHKLVANGRLPAPTHGTLRPRYREDELAGLKEAVSKLREVFIKRSWHTEVAARGYYSITNAAKYLGVPYITFQSFLSKKRLPRPTHRIKSMNWYTQEELDVMRNKELAAYFAEKKQRHALK